MGSKIGRGRSEPERLFAEARHFLSTPGSAEEASASGERTYRLNPRGIVAAPRNLSPADVSKHEAAARMYNAAVSLIACSEAIKAAGQDAEAEEMYHLCLYCHYKWQVLLDGIGSPYSSVTPFGFAREDWQGTAMLIFEQADHSPFEANLRAMGWREP